MHGGLMRFLRLYPVSSEAVAIADAFDLHLTAQALEQELAYFRSPAGRIFERPYGWAWLLELQAEALALKSRWSRALAPLATEPAHRFGRYVRTSPYPERNGPQRNLPLAS